AVRVLAAATEGRALELTHADLAGTAELPVLGAFVSIKRSGRLRGCCGFLGQSVPLAHALMHAARSTANDDHRFPPVAPRELPHLDVEVWLLSNQQPVQARGKDRIDAIQIGKHGLQIARGQSRGLLLPGVATDNGMSAEQFLEHVCLKAELPPTAWREEDTVLWTFEGHSIRSPLSEAIVTMSDARSGLPVTAQHLPALGNYCATNLRAFVSGATPSYFAFGLPDGNVHGLALSLIMADGRELMQGNRISLKDRMPLQSTLFAMTEGLAQAFRRLPPAQQQGNFQIGLTILSQPSLHGTVAEPDLRGVDPRRQMLLVIDRNRTGALYDPQQSPEALVAAAANEAGIRSPETAQVIALECVTNLARSRIVNVPAAAAGSEVRPPAVAGRFYPADAAELSKLIDDCLPKKKVSAKAWPAVMVPHAGLIYSGGIAAQTLARVKFPSTIIVIGPKHTPHGLEWAVAPHATWSIPGATLPSDPELARQLCQAIPGLQMDAAAHA